MEKREKREEQDTVTYSGLLSMVNYIPPMQITLSAWSAKNRRTVRQRREDFKL